VAKAPLVRLSFGVPVIAGGPRLGDHLRAAAADCRCKRLAAGDDLFALPEHAGVAGNGAGGDDLTAECDDVADFDRAG